MAISEAYSGSTAIGTATGEYSMTASSTALGTVTDDGVYQAWLDLNALEKSCIVEFKTYEKVTSAATQRVTYSVRFANAQTEPNWVSPSLVLMHGWEMTLKTVAGTALPTIPWSIRKIA